jgi:hypothetical protein
VEKLLLIVAEILWFFRGMSSTRSTGQYKLPKTVDNSGMEIKKANNMKEDNKTEKKEVFVNKPTTSSSPTTIDAQARDWFRSLSSEERSGATRFSDRAFLGTFLALATPWPTTTTTSTTATATASNDDNHVCSGEYKILCRFYVYFPGVKFYRYI